MAKQGGKSKKRRKPGHYFGVNWVKRFQFKPNKPEERLAGSRIPALNYGKRVKAAWHAYQKEGGKKSLREFAKELATPGASGGLRDCACAWMRNKAEHRNRQWERPRF